MKYVKVFYDWLEMCEALDDAEFGSMIRALLTYAESGECGEVVGNARILLPIFKVFVNRETDSYDKKISAARKGGLSKKKQNEAEVSKECLYKEKEKEQDKDKEQDKEQDNEKEKDETGARAREGLSPSKEEIVKYCEKRGNGVDADAFYDYYDANGWMVGKNPMRDWKAAVRNWERHRDIPKSARKGKSFDTNDFFSAALEKSYGAEIVQFYS